MTRLRAPLGLLVIGLLLLAGAVAGLVTRERNAAAVGNGTARVVLWYPVGAAAGCVLSRGARSCSTTPLGNINEGGQVVARSVPLRAAVDSFRWSVSPDEVTARNRRQRDAYLACVAARGTRCALPEALVPSWNSGMRVQWSPQFDGAYPIGTDPGAGSGGWQVPVVLGVGGAIFAAAGAWWLATRLRRPGTGGR